MYRLYVFFAFGVLLAACKPKVTSENPQQTASSQPSATKSETTESKFPDDWIGTWIGELGIYRGTKKLQSVPMEMVIEAADTIGRYTRTTTNLGKDTIVKPSEHQTLNEESGQYLIDEKNTIKIETYLFDKKLVSWYDVQGTMILASHELRNGQLLFEIIAGQSKEVSTTGGTTFEGEEIPPVRTFPITTTQQATLSRKK